MTQPVPASGPRSHAERWQALGAGWRAALVVVALVVGVNVLLAGVRQVTGGAAPGGKPSSSYATARDGAAAYAELLVRRGHPVERLRSALDRAPLRAGSTLVVLDPRPLEEAESAALERFVRSGGRLVLAGRETAPVLQRLLPEGPVWSPSGMDRARPLVPSPEVSRVASVRASGEGSWNSVGSALPVLAGRPSDTGPSPDDSEPLLAAVAAVGEGRVVLVADAGLFQNRLLAEEDNAEFAVAAVGARGRPVDFAEATHGYRESEGLAAVPSRWRWAIGGLVVAALVWMWSRARRFGPAEEAARPLPPPRRAYVDAVAASVARAKQPDAGVEPLRTAAFGRLARRAGLSPDAGATELVDAARRLGGDPVDVARLLGPITDDDDLVGAGRAAAWVLAKRP
ncbi:MAG: DUF4350 domain-containing protein [Actinomycetota bacterium]|nr:DUF4350 domain-containing protein [Actinomycetota bacterium]